MEFLVGPLAIAVLTAFLAAVISVVDSTVNNYGEVEIDVNDGKKTLSVTGGGTLLFLLSNQKIYLPSACGGRGSCGTCKCRLNSKIGPILPTETPYLTPQEQEMNVRLSCQVKVKSDVRIQIPEFLFNVKEFRGRVLSLKDVTHDIKELLVDLGDQEIDFVPGMYAQLIIPRYGKIRGETQRAYSISSLPSDNHRIEFLVRLVPEGIATTYVHQYLNEGDNIEIIGPFGEFCRSDSDATMICIAGGSGMAPFKSIIYDMQEKGEVDREIWYFFGAVSLKDMFYLDTLEKLANGWKNFHFIPALSSPKPEDHWDGEVGLITDVVDRYLQNVITPEHPKEAYLCGSPGMIDACVAGVLKKHGIIGEKIFYDKF